MFEVSSENKKIKSVNKALDVLDFFLVEAGNHSMTDIARKLKIHKSTVSRLMSTLESEGYLYQCPVTRKYRLGGKILALSATLLANIDVRDIAAPHIRELSKKIGQVVEIFIIEDDHSICIDRVESIQKVRISFHVGERTPLYAGAPGKLLLAFMPPEERDKMIDNLHFLKLTPNTNTNRDDLRKAVKQIHEKKLAITSGEVVEVFTSVAVPIYDSTKKVIASMAISGLSSTFTPSTIEVYTKMARDTSAIISRAMGYLG
jgi:IclR family transcriptional regulator, KDG regulon repressor